MGKIKKQADEREETCRADADDVKYMMLLNAINESNKEEETNNQKPLEQEPSDNSEQK